MTYDRESLPFFIGLGNIAERFAQRHHNLEKNSTAVAAHPTMATWGEIWTAGLNALKSVSVQIEKANTEAEAASASLRRSHVLQGVQETQDALLGIAAHSLSCGFKIEEESGKFCGFVSYGRSELGKELEPIPRSHWEAGTMDWQRRHLVVAEGIKWTGVKVLDCADLNVEQTALVFSDFYPKAGQQVETTVVQMPRGTVPVAKLNAFLGRYVAKHEAGSSYLTENRLRNAAEQEFDGYIVTRAMVRGWIKEHMPVEKQFQPGRKPT